MLSAEDAYAQLNLAIRTLNAGETGEALVLLNETLAKYPSLSQIHYARAIAFARQGRLKNAIEAVDTLLTEHPTHKYGIALKADLSTVSVEPTVNDLIQVTKELWRKGDLEAALQSVLEIKALKIPTAGVDLLRARILYDLKRIGDTREALKEEIRFFPDNTEAKALLDRIVQEEKVISNFPQDPEFLELLKITRPYTMLPDIRLYSLFTLAKYVCVNRIPGNFVECGVAGGGSSALLAAVIQRYSDSKRVVYCCDSFEGLPAPTEKDAYAGKNAKDLGWGAGTCSAPEASLMEICEKLGVGALIRTVKGYYENTLPVVKSEIGAIGLIHIDCDWYESTKTVLNNLYDSIVVGGAIQFDDYGYWEGVGLATQEFLQSRSLSLTVKNIDGGSAWALKQI